MMTIERARAVLATSKSRRDGRWYCIICGADLGSDLVADHAAHAPLCMVAALAFAIHNPGLSEFGNLNTRIQLHTEEARAVTAELWLGMAECAMAEAIGCYSTSPYEAKEILVAALAARKMP